MSGLLGLGSTLGNATDGLTPSLSQAQQNVGGVWGLITGGVLPKYLPGVLPSAADGTPWGNITATNSDPYRSAPNTGITRTYDFSIAPCSMAPDGVYLQNEICVNNQFPGPLVEANYGDWIEVKVTNNMPVDSGEGTTIHWHGMLQTNTTQQDGVPSVSQCPIAPGSSYTYKFRADLYGTSWYHSHYGSQYSGGVFGPLVIYGPSAIEADVDIGPVMVQDWYHDSWHNIVDSVASSGGGPDAPKSNNVLINGKMVYDCTHASLPCTPNAGVSKFAFQSGKMHRLRFMNTGAQGNQRVSIDGHSLIVIAQDFVPVVPFEVKVLALGVGQRYDVLVNATAEPGSAFWMRSNMGGCSNNDGRSIIGQAAVYYEDADSNYAPNSTDDNGNNDFAFCASPSLTATIPLYEIEAPEPDHVETLNFAKIRNGSYSLYGMNGSSYHGDYSDPSLITVYNNEDGSLEFPTQLNAINFGNARTVRVIMYNSDSDFHPMHLHGHNFQVLAAGQGTWDGKITRQTNPQRRDTELMPPGLPNIAGYLVVQWTQDNPGVWPLHCHIAWHVATGYFVQFIERPEEIQNFGNIPDDVNGNCKIWNDYVASHNNIDDVDSGV